MNAEVDGLLVGRAALYRTLGDPSRLAIVDLVASSDRTPGELRDRTGLDWNLLGFHLRTLEDAGVIERQRSEGDRRRRYVRLRSGVLDQIVVPLNRQVARPLFVCTHNSARSPFAAALWAQLTGQPAGSAGTDPAEHVHPLAVDVAADYGVDLSDAHPNRYEDVTIQPGVVISVCDRAAERPIPFTTDRIHWSVPDPASHARPSFERAFADIAQRMTRLTTRAA